MLRLLLCTLIAAASLAREAYTVTSELAEKGFKPVPYSATASSTLCEGKGAKKTCHEPKNLADTSLATAWCEGAQGAGEKESVTFTFDTEVVVGGLDLVPFYGKSFKVARANGRPKTVTVQAGGKSASFQLEDVVPVVERENSEKGPDPEDGPCGDETCATRDERITSMRVAFALPEPVKTKTLVVRIDEVHDGGKYPDLCISEVKVLAKR